MIVSAPGRPRQRRGPGFVVGEICRSASRQQQLDHVRQVVAGGPRQRSRTVVLVWCGDIGTGIEKNGRAFSTMRPWLAAAVASAKVVQRRCKQPIGQVGVHAAIEQQPQHGGVIHEVGPAFRQHGRHPSPAGQQVNQEVMLPPLAHGGERSAAAGIGRAGVFVETQGATPWKPGSRAPGGIAIETATSPTVFENRRGPIPAVRFRSLTEA